MGAMGGATGSCETCIHEVWVVGAMWDHGAMSHGCQGVEGMGAMRWTWEGWGGVRAGRAERAGMHRGPLKRGHGKRAWGEGVCGWWQPCGILGHELEPGSRAWSQG